MARQTTCGEALVRLLERRGIDTVFGIPGVHTLELYRGLAGSSIRHVLVRHEQGAGFMADGYARISGRPAVCLVITGPGVTNIATPMAQAYSDSVPMLVISTVRDKADLGHRYGRLHEITDQRAVTTPLSAFAATAMSPREVPELIDRAFAVFEGARPRPVHIEIPIDVTSMPADGDWRPALPVAAPRPDAGAVAAAAELLGAAERPVVIAGGGAANSGAVLPRLAETLGAPMVMTTAAKGLVEDSHPLCLRTTLACVETQEFLAEADVILAAGTELAETDHWCDQLSLPGKIVRVDIDPDQVDVPYPAAIAVVGDATIALDAIRARLADHRANDRFDGETRVRDILDAIAGRETDLRHTHRRVLEVLRGALPETAAVFSDVTQIAYAGNEIYPAPRPRTWFHPNGYGTLGHALPATIGGKLAAPSVPMVTLIGDGGFQFTVQELGVAAELGLHMTVVIWNNEALGEIRDRMIDKGIETIGVEQRNPDFRLLGEAYGARYLRPKDCDELAAGLARSVAEPGLWLIEARQSDFE